MNIALNVRYILIFENNGPKIIKNGTILIDGNTITHVGKDLKTEDREIYEFANHIVIPGLINTHSHAAMTLFRGYADDVPLDEWLNEYIWPLEARLSPEHVENAAKLAALELIKSGTTTINSMYWHPDSELSSFKDMGVRMMAGPPIISGVSNFESFEYLVNKWHGKYDDMTRVTLNPHAPYTVTPDDFQKIRDYKDTYNTQNPSLRLKIHTHLAETKIEMDLINNFRKEQGYNALTDIFTPTQYLESIKLLDEDLIAAHVVECTTEDLNLLRKNNVGVALNVVSNLKLGNGFAKISEMEGLGMKIGIGTDGPASNNSFDMFQTMKISTLIQKSVNQNPTILPAGRIILMATLGGANVLGWDGIGNIKQHHKADLVFINLNQPHLMPIINDQSLLSLLVYSVNQNDVSDVMINGKWKLKDKKFVDIDDEVIKMNFDATVENLFQQEK